MSHPYSYAHALALRAEEAGERRWEEQKDQRDDLVSRLRTLAAQLQTATTPTELAHAADALDDITADLHALARDVEGY